jgi:H+/gluconate symporter-like permease
VIGILGRERAVLSIVVVCAILTYCGVSLFVVVFMASIRSQQRCSAKVTFRNGLSLPPSPSAHSVSRWTHCQERRKIQNIIPTTFFNTTTWAAPILGLIGSAFVLIVGLFYIESRRRAAQSRGEGYGTGLLNEPEPFEDKDLPNPWIAVSPLLVVGVANFVLTFAIPRAYGGTHEIKLGDHPIITKIAPVAAIWAVEGALMLGILTVFLFAWRPVLARFADGSKAAVAGALLASLNTASEYGLGGVIALLPGFKAVSSALSSIPNPLVNEAVTVTVLAGITGSASGGMSIALAAMSDNFIAAAKARSSSQNIQAPSCTLLHRQRRSISIWNLFPLSRRTSSCSRVTYSKTQT